MGRGGNNARGWKCPRLLTIDASQDLYGSRNSTTVDLQDLVCWSVQGPQMGGILPLRTNAYDECAEGTPTPLASLAATNTGNAQLYVVTYTSASFGETTTGDYIPTEMPYCLWADTAHGVAMTEITVPAAQDYDTVATDD